MRRPHFLARQAGHPTGFVGRLLLGVMARETASFNAEVLDVLAIDGAERVLELGFGHGRTLAAAAARAPTAQFAGLDVAATSAQAAARRCRALVAAARLDLRVGDASDLPWEAAAFDAVYAVHTLYFWPEPARQLAETHRVLSPGGRLVLGFREQTAAAVARFPPPTYRFHSVDEVAVLLTEAGFAHREVRSARSGAELRIAVASR